MALVSRLPSLSSSITHFQKPRFSSTSPIYYIQCRNSPFTEKHSIERYQRDNWLYKNITSTNQLEQQYSFCPLPSDPSSVRDHDIALQLPELKKLLQVLREKRENEGGVGKRGPGNVFLVGTGPGDPDLLTIKALRAIQSADLLLYDRLVSNDVLDLVSPDARLLYVGKTAGYHSRTQVKILQLEVSLSELFGC